MTEISRSKPIDIDKCVKQVKFYLRKSTENIIKVGEELMMLKNQVNALFGAERERANKAYKLMYNELPFKEGTGNKFIAIASDKNINKYIDYCPSAYYVLYELLLKKTDNEWKQLIEMGLNPSSTGNEVSERNQKLAGVLSPNTQKNVEKDEKKKKGSKSETKTNTNTSESKSEKTKTDDKSEAQEVFDNAGGKSAANDSDGGQLPVDDYRVILSISVDALQIVDNDVRNQVMKYLSDAKSLLEKETKDNDTALVKIETFDVSLPQQKVVNS